MEDEYLDDELDPEEELERILDRVDAWGVEFSRSSYFEPLSDEQKEESEAIVMHFTEYMYTYLDLEPEEWDTGGLEECCLEVLPRKISAEEVYFRSVAPVLAAFFRFLAEKKILGNASQLARRVEKLDREIVRNARDPSNWGIAKSFVMAAMQAGVDPTNQEDMEAFMHLYNLQLMAQDAGSQEGDPPFLPPPEPPVAPGFIEDECGTLRRATPKVGRNDPCPCGSGKKYKKCCGQQRGIAG